MRYAPDSDGRSFARWCGRQGFDADRPSPQVVGLLLASSADGTGVPTAAVSTIKRRLAAIITRYRSVGTPLARHIVVSMAGIQRTHGRLPNRWYMVACCAVLPRMSASGPKGSRSASASVRS